MPAPWSGMAGDPMPDDVVFVAVVRLPWGEAKYMREAFEEDAPTMNATSPPFFADYDVDSLEGTSMESALRTLGVWDGKLVT